MDDEIRKYDRTSTFLNDCKIYLMQNECENNVILGICNRFLNKSIDLEKSILIATIDKNGTIISCAVTTDNKPALATFITESDAAIKPMVDYFHCHQINLKGVTGKTAIVNGFLKMYSKPIVQSTVLLLNIIKDLKNIELVQNSELKLATIQDLPILTVWLKNFQIAAGLLPLKPDEEIRATTENKIQKKLLYKLVVNEDQQIVSMVAIARETDNFAILSWVYTPSNLRNKGFASTAVYKLTELVINTQQKHCALFTDKLNPTSNKIYQNIGYEPVAEYLDIDFDTL
ncbi:hypothetical protein I4U23_015349 [Adineta vaga]|nr:hypothetical protein I4U23_015349 [Adineta vaga]